MGNGKSMRTKSSGTRLVLFWKRVPRTSFLFPTCEDTVKGSVHEKEKQALARSCVYQDCHLSFSVSRTVREKGLLFMSAYVIFDSIPGDDENLLSAEKKHGKSYFAHQPPRDIIATIFPCCDSAVWNIICEELQQLGITVTGWTFCSVISWLYTSCHFPDGTDVS